jgi:hypothetical protein
MNTTRVITVPKVLPQRVEYSVVLKSKAADMAEFWDEFTDCWPICELTPIRPVDDPEPPIVCLDGVLPGDFGWLKAFFHELFQKYDLSIEPSSLAGQSVYRLDGFPGIRQRFVIYRDAIFRPFDGSSRPDEAPLWEKQVFHHHEHVVDYAGGLRGGLCKAIMMANELAEDLMSAFPERRFVIEIVPNYCVTFFEPLPGAPTESEDWEPAKWLCWDCHTALPAGYQFVADPAFPFAVIETCPQCGRDTLVSYKVWREVVGPIGG